ncbi:hypothetical protein C8J56DRAFT_1124391 [Mycena floridula]|nr:hypothetical protein C8J56DRAFT_1124391 [Mycena floridula]
MFVSARVNRGAFFNNHFASSTLLQAHVDEQRRQDYNRLPGSHISLILPLWNWPVSHPSRQYIWARPVWLYFHLSDPIGSFRALGHRCASGTRLGFRLSMKFSGINGVGFLLHTPSAGPPAPSRSYCPVLLDGLPVTAENINMSPVSYHCRPHNHVVKALITGQDLYGTRFSTLLQLQPKPASLDTTADVLLGSDWLRDCAIHAIQNRPDTAPAAISQPLASPAEDLSAVKDNVILRWPLSHRSTGMISGKLLSQLRGGEVID